LRMCVYPSSVAACAIAGAIARVRVSRLLCLSLQ
jgi:hypothetical protein